MTLSTVGRLAIVCGVTGIMLWEGDEDDPPVLNMTLLQGDEDQNQLLLLLHDPTGDGNLLRIVSFPSELPSLKFCVARVFVFYLLADLSGNISDYCSLWVEFQTVYELAVNSGTKLVNIGEGAESITFLEPDVSCVTGVINNIKLKSIVDGVPEARWE